MKKVQLDILGKENPFDLIGQQWMLITAGVKDSFNTMTASWGGLGWLWNKPVAFIFVRPERYTHDFLESSDKVTLSFFPESCRKALQICGSKSGRDCDKVKEAGLSPVSLEDGAVTFGQARLTLACRKLLKTDMKPVELLDKEILDKWYSSAGLHSVYVLEIESLWEKAEVNPDILSYLNADIIPQYRKFDSAHTESHVTSVLESALAMCRYYDVDQDMIAVAAAFHDLGVREDRETHHLISGRIIRETSELRRWFCDDQIETIAQAAEDHRASSDHEPRSIYGKIIAEADRQIDPETVIRRTIQFSLAHYPTLDMEGHWKRTLEHLHEKYADGGYLKLWIPESPNAGRLERLREIIRDEKGLRSIFEEIYNQEQ